MISHIDIKDFAIIKDLSLDIGEGLNIITGETGAGKSVIIEAISMALGARADTDYIRTGAEKAVISMLIDTKDEQYSIKREISAGKSLCRINGELVSLSELSNLCKNLVDIHGQYDNQSLLNPDNHISILDLYGKDDVLDAKRKTADAYRAYADSSTKLMNLRKKLADSERQKDFLKFEVEEINAANLKLGEDEELKKQISLMENSEKIYGAISEAQNSLYEDGGAGSSLGAAMNALSEISKFSPDFDELYKRISDAYYEIDDLSSSLRNLKDAQSFSQNELDDAIERLDCINKLCKKYGGSIEKVLEHAKEAELALGTIINADSEMEKLEKEIAKQKEIYDKEALALSEKRKSAAKKLSININKELEELNFKNAIFDVKFTESRPTENGTDIIEFLISANKGEELRPLAKVASGGELSRIMLALKRIVGDLDGIETMIFDEIDAGISGATAGVVGDKLKSISKNHQIVCITHLPQIACKGDNHYRIQKSSDEISTETTVVPLGTNERIEEIARLLSGTTITDSARSQARELLGI